MGPLTADAAEQMKDTPMYQLYERVAPRPEDFGRLLEKIGAFMTSSFDYTRGHAQARRFRPCSWRGDADQAPPAHYAEMFGLLGGGHDGGWMGENRPAGGHALAILPGLQHYDIFASPLLATTLRCRSLRRLRASPADRTFCVCKRSARLARLIVAEIQTIAVHD